MPAYAISRLEKSFPGSPGGAVRQALDGVSFVVNSGELLVVLGKNGAGKSTLLRVLAGLTAPEGGDIRSEGKSLAGIPPYQRDIAMVFQNFSLYPRFSVSKNLEMPLRSRGSRLTEDEITARVNETADMLGLLSKLQRRPGELSGGEMQRVALGRALIRRPKLFLLDEPLTHLDARLREQLRTEIRDLQRRLGVTMIYVTHDHEEAMVLGDRILALDQGRVLQIGTPEEIYKKPRNSKVAGLLGRPPINLIPSDKAAELGLPQGRGRMVGIRPESFRVMAAENGAAEVKAVENLGPALEVVLEAGGMLLRALMPPSSRPKIGDKMQMSVDPGALHWFSE